MNSRKVKVGQDDPAVLLDWHYQACENFILHANNNPHLQGTLGAFFISSAPGQMSVTTLQSDVLRFLSQSSGGRFGNTLLAPNDMEQYGNILERIFTIELHPFMQGVAGLLQAGEVLATVYYLLDRKLLTARPVNRIDPLLPAHKLFE